jgi:hypothetical protein
MLVAPCLKLGLEVVVERGLNGSEVQEEAEENCPDEEEEEEEETEEEKGPEEEQVERESQLLGVW